VRSYTFIHVYGIYAIYIHTLISLSYLLFRYVYGIYGTHIYTYIAPVPCIYMRMHIEHM